MELLQPLGVLHIGLFARNAFDVARVDEVDINACKAERIIKGDPVVACTFEGRSADAMLKQPVAQRLDARGEHVKGAHRDRSPARGQRCGAFLRANVNACSVGVRAQVDAGVAARLACSGGTLGFGFFRSANTPRLLWGC